jgi:hypothetical protein
MAEQYTKNTIISIYRFDSLSNYNKWLLQKANSGLDALAIVKDDTMDTPKGYDIFVNGHSITRTKFFLDDGSGTYKSVTSDDFQGGQYSVVSVSRGGFGETRQVVLKKFNINEYTNEINKIIKSHMQDNFNEYMRKFMADVSKGIYYKPGQGIDIAKDTISTKISTDFIKIAENKYVYMDYDENGTIVLKEYNYNPPTLTLNGPNTNYEYDSSLGDVTFSYILNPNGNEIEGNAQWTIDGKPIDNDSSTYTTTLKRNQSITVKVDGLHDNQTNLSATRSISFNNRKCAVIYSPDEYLTIIPDEVGFNMVLSKDDNIIKTWSSSDTYKKQNLTFEIENPGYIFVIIPKNYCPTKIDDMKWYLALAPNKAQFPGGFIDTDDMTKLYSDEMPYKIFRGTQLRQPAEYRLDIE